MPRGGDNLAGAALIEVQGQYAVWFLVVVWAVVLAVYLRYDRLAYRRFKALTATADRQRCFRNWIVQSALLFGGGAVLGLAILGRLAALRSMPTEFLAVAAQLPKIPLHEHLDDFVLGAGIGIVGGIIAVIVVVRLGRKKKKPAKPMMLGDIEPILPRNVSERVWAALIALNAGWCEELFFRILLPLLLTLATGNALVGFGVAIAIFGLVHLYQGISGILATTVLGALFAAIYLITGNIWIAAAVHALVDLNGLLLQPLLRGRGAQ